MRWLEIRRHSVTKKGPSRGRGSHLSARGVALARLVGAELGTFAYVLTSSSPRAIETALAMGYAVDETIDMPSGYLPGEVEHHDQWSWPQPYVTHAELIGRGGGLAAIAQAHAEIWTEAVAGLPDGRGALVVSHGGCIEPALVRCLPAADHASWGAPFGHCDGARLDLDGGRGCGVDAGVPAGHTDRVAGPRRTARPVDIIHFGECGMTADAGFWSARRSIGIWCRPG